MGDSPEYSFSSPEPRSGEDARRFELGRKKHILERNS